MSKRRQVQDLIDELDKAVETFSNQIDCGFSSKDLAVAAKRLKEARSQLSDFLDAEFGKL